MTESQYQQISEFLSREVGSPIVDDYGDVNIFKSILEILKSQHEITKSILEILQSQHETIQMIANLTGIAEEIKSDRWAQ